MQHFGIDVSADQHPLGAPIDYRAAVESLRSLGAGATPFVIVKGWEGGQQVNPFYQVDCQGFAAAGAVVANYVFARPGAELSTQIECFAGVKGPIMVDAETTDGEPPAVVGNIALGLLEVIWARGNRTALYTYLDFEPDLPGAPWGFPLWLAEPGRAPGSTTQECLFHQYATGALAGISTAVDLDVFCGTEEEWLDFFFQPQEDSMGRVTRDLKTGGILCVNDLGQVYAERGARYWGGCTPDMGVGPTAPNGPAVGIVSYEDSSYTVVTEPPTGPNAFEFYDFPEEIAGVPSMAALSRNAVESAA